MNQYTVKEVSVNELNAYASIPIKTMVTSEFIVKEKDKGLGGLVFEEVNVNPYIYDIDEDPTTWPKEFDTSSWGFFIVYDEEKPIAGMTLVYNTEGINMLSHRNDLTVLWDIRVTEEYKSKQIGSQLFLRAIEWAKNRNCSQLKIETQTKNVPACRFYAKMGCHLGEINTYAYYPEHDIMLIWYYNLID